MLKFLMNGLECFVPVGITFGPLFMTNNAGTAVPDHGLVYAGTLMVTFSLFWMFRTIRTQRTEIEQLKKDIAAK